MGSGDGHEGDGGDIGAGHDSDASEEALPIADEPDVDVEPEFEGLLHPLMAAYDMPLPMPDSEDVVPEPVDPHP